MSQIITWLGHGSWYMETPKGTKCYIDPWIVGNPSCPIGLEDIKEADLVFVTHGHNDHLGNAIEICLQTGATLVTLPDVAAYCEKYGIPNDKDGGSVHVGGSIVQRDIRVRAVFALHYSDIWGFEQREDPTAIMPGSGCCGFILEPEGGRSVYFAGDTGVFGDMSLISRLYHPYVSVLPVGDKFTMGVREASVAAEMLGSKYVLPGHYNTFPANQADTDVLKALMAECAPASTLIVLKPGETFTLD